MALEHNIIYFATKVEEKRRNPISEVEEPKEVAVSTKDSYSLADLRTAADLAGVPMSLILKRLTDADDFYLYAKDPVYSVERFFSTDSKREVEVRKTIKTSNSAGSPSPAISNNSFKTTYLSYRRKLDEMNAITPDIKSNQNSSIVEQ